MNRYHPSTLEKRKGKWYVSVTKPRELQFGKDRQKRKSTGTSDKRQAEYLQHELTQAIYDEFDKELKKTDRFFEAVRPLLEAEGVRTRDWYDKLTDDPTLTLHSTRHSYKDLNRDAGVSKEIQDFITGHAQGDVASSYGQGPRGGSVCLNRFLAFSKWFSALVTPLPLGALAG